MFISGKEIIADLIANKASAT